MQLSPGSLVDSRFEIVRTIGIGGMGAVYVAKQLDLERLVALKFMLPELQSEQAFKRFQQEARILSTLAHPNIVAVHSFGQWHDSFYISMEYFEARGLDELIRQAPLSPPVALAYTRQICSGLAFVHEHDILHRDLKPSNVLVSKDGTVKLIDFGLAKAALRDGDQQLTEPGAAVGTVLYMSPEQCMSGEVDARSDIYALGCNLYHMLTGKPPFEDFMQTVVMHQHVYEPIPTLPGAQEHRSTRALDAVIQNCTQKDPANRYQTARELLTELQGLVIDETPIPAVVHHPIQITQSPKSSSPLGTIFGAIVVTFILGGAIFASGQMHQEKPQTSRWPSFVGMPLIRQRELALRQSNAGDHEAAIATFSNALHTEQPDGEVATSYTLLCQEYRVAHQYENALKLAKRFATAKHSFRADGLAQMALAYLALGDAKQAASLWHEVEVAGRMKEPWQYESYSRALHGAGNDKEAVVAAEEGLKIGSQFGPPDANLAKTLDSLRGALAEAKQALAEADRK